MNVPKFIAFVTKTYLSGQNGIGEPGVDECDAFITVTSINFTKNGIDLVADDEGNEYSYVDDSLKAVLMYTGMDDCTGAELYDGDVFASVRYGTTELSSGDLRWEIYYNEKQMCFYARDQKEEINRPLAEFQGGMVSYKKIGNVNERPNLVRA